MEKMPKIMWGLEVLMKTYMCIYLCAYIPSSHGPKMDAFPDISLVLWLESCTYSV